MPISQAEYLNMEARLNRNRKLSPVPADAVGKESELHQQIAEYCRSKGWIALHGAMNQATARTLGEPDFIIMAGNVRWFAVECKTKTGKLSMEQLALQAVANKLGHNIHVVRSMSEFLEIVKD